MTTCPNELFDCANCFHQGALDPHGRCERCGSEAVFSVSVRTYSDERDLEPYTRREWEEKVTGYAFRCAYCGGSVYENAPDPIHELTKDHVIPIVRGGVDILSNIVPCCMRCNRLKRNQTAAEFLASRPGLCKAALFRQRNQQVVLSLVGALSRRKTMERANVEKPDFYWQDRRQQLAQQVKVLSGKRPSSITQAEESEQSA